MDEILKGLKIAFGSLECDALSSTGPGPSCIIETDAASYRLGQFVSIFQCHKQGEVDKLAASGNHGILVATINNQGDLTATSSSAVAPNSVSRRLL